MAQLKGLPSVRPSVTTLLSGRGTREGLNESASGDPAGETAEQSPEPGFICLPSRSTFCPLSALPAAQHGCAASRGKGPFTLSGGWSKLRVH